MEPGSNYVRYITADAASTAFARVSEAISGVSTTINNYNDRADYLQEQIDFMRKVLEETLPGCKKWWAEPKGKNTYSDAEDFEVGSDELDAFLSDFARTEG